MTGSAGLVSLTQAVRAPTTTGAIAPGGRTLTRALLALLGPDSRLDVVEADGASSPACSPA